MSRSGVPITLSHPRWSDLTRWPLLGRFLRLRHARTIAQTVLLVLAALVLYDGFFGPPIAPKNLAGVLPWVHWRGLVVLALLLAGNLFCFACPFMLPRRLAQLLFRPRRSWPRWLPGKWVAIVLLVTFFWAYEAFDLWASPLLTAWVALAYFVAAFAIDGFFRGAAFCKHVCPIGQFNFIGSLVSPTEVRIRDASVCQRCRTKDCIRGRFDRDGRLVQRGCELGLFQPAKVGNLDCTFCLDCLHACPHQNVGIRWRFPLRAETDPDSLRSGIGRLSGRHDWATLVVVLTALGFLNAFGMVSPVYHFLRWLSQTLHVTREPVLLAIVFAGGLAVLATCVTLASLATRWLLPTPSPRWSGMRFVYTLAPLGFGMWSAHYLFHFFTGALTVLPLAQQFAVDVTGRALLGQPAWHLASLLSVAATTDLVVIVLALGYFGSLFWTMRLGSRYRLGFIALLPWLGLNTLLFLFGIWLLGQPMEMRGTLLG
ncbi:FesM [Thermomicrobium sp. 4228-Ro]|uniref:FesM n=1 Tax=Thermomicrobium sp. 4228-Ro TaxID=2993937 RepID=UPI002248D3D3|nr:FesM [Thermomicrobium sp. 4228-Ro]MCX2727626.1 FesM [Thermomicrobium sp. 4228-Ro]